MLRNVLNSFVRISRSRKTTQYLFKFRAGSYRNYSQLFRHKRKNPWNHTISVRNIKKKSRKDVLIESFYKNVYQGLLVIAVSTFIYCKIVGLKLLLLQLAPIAYVFRNHLLTIKHTFTRDIKLLYKYFKTVGAYNTYENKNLTLYRSFKEVALKHPKDVMFQFGDHNWSYKEMLTLVDNLAYYFHKKEFDKGDVVGVFMTNRPDYIALILAFSRLGTVACLLNTHLKKQMLLKRVEGINCKALIVSRDLLSVVDSIKDALVAQKITLYLYDGPVQDKKFINLRDELIKVKDEGLVLQYQVKFHDRIMYTFTGNSFGYPSPFVVTNAKFIFTGLAAAEVLNATRNKDVIYSVLPFYKAENIATSLGPTILKGVKAVIKKEFSVTDYFKDCKLHDCTLAQYGGEMGKYLAAQKPTKYDKIHKVRYMFGRGMHQNIWEYLQERFNVKIIEYYGTTASNIHLVNLDFHRGAVGYLPKFCPPMFHPYQIIRIHMHDTNPIRTQGGICERLENYETGMLVGLVSHRPDSQFIRSQIFDKDGKERNMVRNVVRKGDKGFLSGDLFLRDKYGYFYFKGQAGVNFRWQRENVSVYEMEAIIRETTGIKSFVYYGVKVPNAVDRIGMILIKDVGAKLNLDMFLKTIKEHLPMYAVPAFVRITHTIEVDPVRVVDRLRYEDDGYDPRKVRDKIFYWNKTTDKYEVLTEAIYADIVSDKILF